MKFFESIDSSTIPGSDHGEKCLIRINNLTLRGATEKTDRDSIEKLFVPLLCASELDRMFQPFEGVLHRNAQTAQMFWSFRDVVDNSGFHRFNGDLFAAAAGEHDDRDFGILLFQAAYDFEPVAPIKLVISNDQVEILALERFVQSYFVCNLDNRKVRNLAVQFTGHQCAIMGIIVNVQNTV